MYSDLFCRDLYGDTSTSHASLRSAHHTRHRGLIAFSLPSTPLLAMPSPYRIRFSSHLLPSEAARRGGERGVHCTRDCVGVREGRRDTVSSSLVSFVVSPCSPASGVIAAVVKALKAEGNTEMVEHSLPAAVTSLCESDTPVRETGREAQRWLRGVTNSPLHLCSAQRRRLRRACPLWHDGARAVRPVRRCAPSVYVPLRWTREQLHAVGVPFLADLHRRTDRLRRAYGDAERRRGRDTMAEATAWAERSCSSTETNNQQEKERGCRGHPSYWRDTSSGDDVVLQLARRYRHARTVFVHVCMNVLLRYAVLPRHHFDRDALLRFVRALSELIRERNPFHHPLHAADAMLAAHEWLCYMSSVGGGSASPHLRDAEVLAFLVASAAGSVGHCGVDNATLRRRRHPFAMMCGYLCPQQSATLSILLALLVHTDTRFLPEPTTTTPPEPPLPGASTDTCSSCCSSCSVPQQFAGAAQDSSKPAPSPPVSRWTRFIEWNFLHVLSQLILSFDPCQHAMIRGALRAMNKARDGSSVMMRLDGHICTHRACAHDTRTAEHIDDDDDAARHADIAGQEGTRYAVSHVHARQAAPTRCELGDAHPVAHLTEADHVILLQGVLHATQACHLFRCYACFQAYTCMAAAEGGYGSCASTLTDGMRSLPCEDHSHDDHDTYTTEYSRGRRGSRTAHACSDASCLTIDSPACGEHTAPRCQLSSLHPSARDGIVAVHRERYEPLLNELAPYLPAVWLRQAHHNMTRFVQRCACAEYVDGIVHMIRSKGENVFDEAAGAERSEEERPSQERSGAKALCEVVLMILLRSCEPVETKEGADRHDEDAKAMRVILSHANLDHKGT